MAVNLSVRQMLAPDIAGLVADVLARTGVRPGDLCLELTESVFMEDVDYFERTLASLKALGVRLAIDDFGTGYSSLSYLKRFPVDAVKVDRAFVDGLGTDPHDSALVARHRRHGRRPRPRGDGRRRRNAGSARQPQATPLPAGAGLLPGPADDCRRHTPARGASRIAGTSRT